jgi:class 3 adenylate cyclase
MATLSKAELADRVGVAEAVVDRLLSIGFIRPDEDGRFVSADARRAQLALSLEDESGIAVDDLANAVKQGLISFEFMDGAPYERWASVSSETFEGVASRTGLPVQLVMATRDAIGGAMPSPGDRMREDELSLVPLLESSRLVGYSPASFERILRVVGDSLRRVADTASELWRVDVIGAQAASGMSVVEIGEWTRSEVPARFSAQIDEALLMIYHAHEAHTWGANIVGVVESAIADAGIQRRLYRPPAMCFLDITGYTRLTQERGDQAAAELAGNLARLVQRTAVAFGGRPVKWLGDGVMLHFRDPGPGVRAALAMVEGVKAEGLPPAHVGLHAGPVVFQDGDYFGQTVNIASRIAEYARPHEVVVSHEVVAASEGAGVSFREIGQAELKGVSETLRLYSAELAV